MAYAIGIDFGTNSVRAIVVDCADGSMIAESVFDYPSGEDGVVIDDKDHNLARQNPADYVEGLEDSVKGALERAKDRDGFSASDVIGIGVDTTGSTPIPVDMSNTPLAMHERWRDNKAALAWLWKDHTSADEAARITATAAEHRPQYLARCGGTYSSEWFWSKIWHCLNTAPDVFDAAHSWVELADYIPAVLSGVRDVDRVKRGVCAAGHKAMYCDEWDGLPDEEFLAMLDPRLADLRVRLYKEAHDADTVAGELCAIWAAKLGLQQGIPVAIGAFDAHYGAIGAGIGEGVLVKIIGTSTCDCIVSPASRKLEDVPGVCGIVNGSILPGYYGLEAGQSAVGDIFSWFVKSVCKGNDDMHEALTAEAEALRPGQSGLLALDWNNGNRTILVNPRLSGLLLGQTLHTTQAEIYRALIEATAFGARAIIERIREYGVPIDRIVCCGGIADKNPLLMRIYADVTGCTMQTSASPQTCALGAALSATVAAGKESGGYAGFEEAQANMTSVKPVEYTADDRNKAIYDRLYGMYRTLHDGFGGVAASSDLSRIMPELISLRTEQSL